MDSLPFIKRRLATPLKLEPKSKTLVTLLLNVEHTHLSSTPSSVLSRLYAVRCKTIAVVPQKRRTTVYHRNFNRASRPTIRSLYQLDYSNASSQERRDNTLAHKQESSESIYRELNPSVGTPVAAFSYQAPPSPPDTIEGPLRPHLRNLPQLIRLHLDLTAFPQRLLSDVVCLEKVDFAIHFLPHDRA